MHYQIMGQRRPTKLYYDAWGLIVGILMAWASIPANSDAPVGGGTNGTSPNAQSAAPQASSPLPASSGSSTEQAEIVIKISRHMTQKQIPQTNASQTVITAQQMQHANPAQTLSEILTQYVPGAVQNPDNSLRIRGADDQFSTYLDGAPVPESVSGSITDIFDPRDIRTVRVYTGGFPAEFGGQLSGLFDVQTKSREDKPSGMLSQSAASDGTYVTDGGVSGDSGSLAYYASGSTRQTRFFLNPPSEPNDFDYGDESHGFVKLNYAAGQNDTMILQLGTNASDFDIPVPVGTQLIPDTQAESGSLANLIWVHVSGVASTRLTLYSHRSTLVYTGNETLQEQEAAGNIDADQNLTASYLGVRGDQTWARGNDHLLRVGFDVSKATADQDFTIVLPPPDGTLTDNSAPHAWNIGLYAQDDWSPGRFLINYGVRYDENSQDVTTNQVSPRVNIRYKLTHADMLHAYYDRLFQPIPVEDADHLVGNGAVGDNGTLSPLLPESDNFYEVGIDHTLPRTTLGLAAYYKTGINVRDDDEVGDTNITLPVNDSKAYFRGVEFTSSRDLSTTLHGFGNLSLSWNKNAGPITGGLNEGDPPAYFYDDHDQTYTGEFGLAYERRGRFADVIGNYGSGQPYGQINDASGNPVAENYLRVAPHLTFNIDAGRETDKGLSVTLFINNLFNDDYIIKQVTSLSTAQYAEGRVTGIRAAVSF